MRIDPDPPVPIGEKLEWAIHEITFFYLGKATVLLLTVGLVRVKDDDGVGLLVESSLEDARRKVCDHGMWDVLCRLHRPRGGGARSGRRVARIMGRCAVQIACRPCCCMYADGGCIENAETPEAA